MDNKIIREGILDLNGFQIPCFITENGDRVLSVTEMQRALGVISNEPTQRSSKRLEEILSSKVVKNSFSDTYDASKLLPKVCYKGNQKISAYEAIVLPEICELMLKARDYAKENGIELGTRQQTVIEHADILIRSLAKIGIIALVDEATGYQYEREKNELQAILTAYISKELLGWQKRFPDAFYKEIFRLKGWDFTVQNIKKRPGVVGTWTNKLIYEQLPKGVLDELKKVTPKTTTGSYKARFHQSLTPDIGHPDLTSQIYKVLGIMNISDSWKDFVTNFNKMVDRKNGQLEIPYEVFEDRPETKKIGTPTNFDITLMGLLSVPPPAKDKND